MSSPHRLLGRPLLLVSSSQLQASLQSSVLRSDHVAEVLQFSLPDSA